MLWFWKSTKGTVIDGKCHELNASLSWTGIIRDCARAMVLERDKSLRERTKVS